MIYQLAFCKCFISIVDQFKESFTYYLATHVLRLLKHNYMVPFGKSLVSHR